MFERLLRRFRECVRTEAYRLTDHALEELEDDDLSVLDFEACVLEGRVLERQRDHRTWEWKYVIEGPALDGAGIIVVAKPDSPGRMIVITVYRI